MEFVLLVRIRIGFEIEDIRDSCAGHRTKS